MGGGGHDDDEGTPFDQSVEEMDFLRSACAMAQTGDATRLRSMLTRRPSVANEGLGGYTPLHYASREGHVNCVAMLLEHGSDVAAVTTAGRATPLHRAAFTGRLDVIAMLLDANADASAVDADGETPLHKASARGHAACVRALMVAAPETGRVEDRKGRRAIDRAADEETRAAFGE
jgi:ankyrin repeat protein